MDREAWWATVHGVTKAQTWLKQLSIHMCISDGLCLKVVTPLWDIAYLNFDKILLRDLIRCKVNAIEYLELLYRRRWIYMIFPGLILSLFFQASLWVQGHFHFSYLVVPSWLTSTHILKPLYTIPYLRISVKLSLWFQRKLDEIYTLYHLLPFIFSKIRPWDEESHANDLL